LVVVPELIGMIKRAYEKGDYSGIHHPFSISADPERTDLYFSYTGLAASVSLDLVGGFYSACSAKRT
jgi:hypothetical protein